MSTTVTYRAAQAHVDGLSREAQRHDLLREAQDDGDPVQIRRLAVIRPAGSHFALMPTGAHRAGSPLRILSGFSQPPDR